MGKEENGGLLFSNSLFLEVAKSLNCAVNGEQLISKINTFENHAKCDLATFPLLPNNV